MSTNGPGAGSAAGLDKPGPLSVLPGASSAPEFVDHDGLAKQLSCSVSTVHKLRRDKILGEPCQIGSLVRWHWPTVRARILPSGATGGALAADPFLDRLDGTA